MNTKLLTWLENLRTAPFVLFGFLAYFLISFIVGIVMISAGMSSNQIDSEISYWYIFLAITIAPVAETYFFQKLPIEFLEKRIKSVAVVILISAALFGILHLKGFFVVIQGIVMGTIFAAAYIVHRKNHGAKRAFWAVAIIHSLANILPLTLRILSGVYDKISIV